MSTGRIRKIELQIIVFHFYINPQTDLRFQLSTEDGRYIISGKKTYDTEYRMFCNGIFTRQGTRSVSFARDFIRRKILDGSIDLRSL